MGLAHSKAQQELLEDHLGEASFLWTLWEDALVSPAYTLMELAEGPEARLLAHLDALTLGGAHTRQKLLLPGLTSDEVGVVTASALALLFSGEEEAEETVLEALKQAEPAAAPSPLRALELGATPRVLKSLSPMLASTEANVLAASLEVLTFWGEEPGPRLGALLSHSDPRVVSAALKAARVTRAPVSEHAVLDGLQSSSAEVRTEALWTALTLGLGSAWPLCRKLAEGPSPDGAALLFLGLGGTDADLERLLEAAKSSSSRAEALWALGFSGRVEAAEYCLNLLEDSTLGRLAAEAFCAISGLRISGPYERPPPTSSEEEEAREEVVASSPEDKLPLAAPDRVHAWWREHQRHFERGGRYLQGRPLSGAWLVEALEFLPMRRRHVLSRELGLRNRGRLTIQSQCFSARQRAEILAGRQVLERTSMSQPFQHLIAVARPPPAAPQQRSPGRARQPPRPHAGRLAITGLGMVSALGDNVIASCAASRAGMSRISSLEEVQVWDPVSRKPESARGAAIPWLTDGFSGNGRLAALSTEALLDLRSHTYQHPNTLCAFHLCAPGGYYLHQMDAREGNPPSRHEERIVRYQQRLIPAVLRAAELQAVKAQPLWFGETGFLLALQAAHRQLDAGEVDSCIIGGVDSLVEPRLVEALDQLRLLKTPGNPVGMLPGEAAAFMQVERWDAAVRRGARVLATLEAPSVDTEPFHRMSRTPAMGEALVRCIRRTMAPLGGPRKQALRVIAALNGDSYRATDWGHALVTLRAQDDLPEAPAWYPAASFGETGAATGLLGICMAVRGLERGYLPETGVLLWVSGDDGSRGSLLIHPPTPMA
ncbi:hypothetical protein A176_000527 [Myxococcus hansupus]|uniref:Beta-ketoacyl synthase-like N-terminal domain-containing protein n=2 Tax=Pseudomyxococcus hansupus TaxID=1297742 RepID=A0A0H4WQL4_9BACT|nr:hypothetical protein A176_000527 [Myxococcus hansupus]